MEGGLPHAGSWGASLGFSGFWAPARIALEPPLSLEHSQAIGMQRCTSLPT